jgi:hypothetical protein
VRYSVFGGAVINWLFVRRDVEKIFAFRTGQLRTLFRAPAISVRGVTSQIFDHRF